MNSNKRCCSSCNCYSNESNKRKRTTNIEPRASAIDKENIIQQKRSCACGCGCARKLATELKPNVRSCQPKKNSENISQFSANKAVDLGGKVNVATRPPLGELKVKSNNIKCSSNCYGAVRKATSTNTQNCNINRKSAPLAFSTVKKYSTRSSSEDATSIDAVTSRKCCCVASKPSSSTSKFPIFEQQPIRIPSKREIEKPENINDSFDFASFSSDSDLSFQSPCQSVETRLTFKTNRLDVQSLQLSDQKDKSEKCTNDNSKLVSNNEPIQIIYDGIPSLRRKTLKKQLGVSSGHQGVVNLDPYTNRVPPYILYSTYMIDVIKNIMLKEENQKIDKDLMKHSNIHPIYRTAVINWLIKLQVYLNSDASVFYICIRLFDKLLANTEIPEDLLQLTGMITYWIANKYGDCVEYLTVSKLEEICRFRYSAREIINHERKILSLLDYNITVEEPIIFVRYYIYLLQIEDSNDMSFCANYLLDCLATGRDINTFPLSLQACAAIFLSIQFLGCALNIWQNLEPYPGFYSPEDLFIVNEKIIERILLIQNENYEFREVFVKYAGEKYNNISVRVCEIVKNLK